MKSKLAVAMFATLSLSACAGLHVSWNASYNMPQIAKQVNPAVTSVGK